MRAPSSDAAQLRAARKDPEAFTAFYRDHAEWLDRWFRVQVGDAHVAADLTAETFAQALTSLGRFRGSGRGEGTAWLFGIGRNLLRRYLARKSVETRAREALEIPLRDYEPDEYAAADERLDAAALAREIEQALGALSPGLRRTLELRTLDGLDYSEIAERTGTTETSARMRVSRALRTAGARLTSSSKELLP
jgi:RNA polymerase sigma-70 factor (ECF subfamily)